VEGRGGDWGLMEMGCGRKEKKEQFSTGIESPF